MANTRILYVASEIQPFLKLSDVADFVRKLPQDMQEKGMEIRILMPRFGLINERKNRLHEVVRLSGTNIPIGDEEKPLIIKVASIPAAKLQVYFIDNEDLFKRKFVFHDKNEEWYADNDDRAIFFCKGVLETVKKLGWAPDIVHCNDWMTGLIPLYLKTTYKEDPIFQKAKVVYSAYDNKFSEAFTPETSAKAMMEGVSEEDVAELPSGYEGFVKTAAANSDVVLDGSTDSEGLASLLGSTDKIQKIEASEELTENYLSFYNGLLEG